MPEMLQHGRALVPFSYYGGKSSHLGWLLPLLNVECSHYIEPFGGSAAVLLSRPPEKLETYNDIDSDVVNFFAVLRDNSEELFRQVKYTPYSREEYDKYRYRQWKDDVDRARLTLFGIISTYQSMTGQSKLNWGYGKGGNKPVNKAVRLQERVERLKLIVDRLARVQIENDSAVNVIKRYDAPNSFFYCDPPYLGEARSEKKLDDAYMYEYTDEQHKELAEVLNNAEGAVAVSGYDSPLIQKLYPEKEWHRHFAKSRRWGPVIKAPRTELLLRNKAAVQKQRSNLI